MQSAKKRLPHFDCLRLKTNCISFSQLQGTASEASAMAILAAKMKSIRCIQKDEPERDQYEIMSKLVAYCSEQVMQNSHVQGFTTWQHIPGVQKKVYLSFLGKRWNKCLLKLTSFTLCNAQTLLYHLTKFYNYWTYTNHSNHTKSQA